MFHNELEIILIHCICQKKLLNAFRLRNTWLKIHTSSHGVVTYIQLFTIAQGA